MVSCFLALCVLTIGVGAATAFASGSGQASEGISLLNEFYAQGLNQTASTLGPTTDAEASEQLPHRDLNRDEAIDLLQAVFGDELQGSAGIFDELQVEKFLSDNVALVGTEGQLPGALPLQDESAPEASEKSQDEEVDSPEGEGKDEASKGEEVLEEETEEADPEGDAPQDEPISGVALIESTLPLRTDEGVNEAAAVDLDLEPSEGELQPTNPLVEVGIPAELGEGISLPEQGVEIVLTGGPADLHPSTVAQSIAVYPNVAQDSDLVVAPTPTGVETFFHLRSAEAPHSQTFHLVLPDDASLVKTDQGGAEVTQNDQAIIRILAPSALDANGNSVPVALSVDKGSISVTASPSSDSAFPILVDPHFETYDWPKYYEAEGNPEWFPLKDWSSASNTTAFGTYNHIPWENKPKHFGPTIISGGSGSVVQGSIAGWSYYVPRYVSDYSSYSVRPTTFINSAMLQQLEFRFPGLNPSRQASPYFWGGIWDTVNGGWISLAQRTGVDGQLLDPYYVYSFINGNHNENAKVFGLNLVSSEPGANAERYLSVGVATLELTDNDYPKFGSTGSPSAWVDQKPTAKIPFSVSDPGLGVFRLFVEQKTSGGTLSKVATFQGCNGGASNPCPRVWSSTEADKPQLSYNPSTMPTGENWVKLNAMDPLSHDSRDIESPQAEVRIKVDHLAPQVALSGTMTEQAKLGPGWPFYGLKVNATDGTAEQPQSGVTETIIEIDGKVVKQSAPGCTTKNCALSLEWTLETGQYSTGLHTVKATAKDAVGLSTTKTLVVNLQPAPPPSVNLTGSMTEQAALGSSRPRYMLKVNASAEKGVLNPTPPAFVSSFGSLGSGDGQLDKPGDVAIDASGNVWVVDRANNRIQKFNPEGKFLLKFGSTGTGNGQFSRPTAIAIGGTGNIFVLDANNGRVQKFTPKGEYLMQFGSKGSGNGQLSSPEGIDIDPKGYVWVADTLNGRVQKFNESGAFLKVIGSKGPGAGQFGEANSIDIGPGNTVWVSDWVQNEVTELSESGEFIRQFGSAGSGPGQFIHPIGIGVDSKGNVLVGDQTNNRVQQFNEVGEFIGQFGSAGAGNGQFSLAYPLGIATDSSGGIWLTDVNNNRVQKWTWPDRQSKISTTIKIDGKQVDSASLTCLAETCPVAREWLLQAAQYSLGKHTVEVKATDGFGRATTKSVTVQLEADKVKPALNLSGELSNAPEGWVEQDSYSFNASATDAGYGVASLKFKINGKTIAEVSKTCPDGGCEASISKPIDMAAFDGGAQSAELIATDGASNTAVKSWTINVDPEGHVSAQEATATLEAVDATSPINTVGAAQEEEEFGGTAPGIGIDQAGSGLIATGTEAPTTIDTDPGGGFTVKVPEGWEYESCLPEEETEEEMEEPEGPSEKEVFSCSAPEEPDTGKLVPIDVDPVNPQAGATVTTPVEKNSAVSANVSNHVDVVVRPLYDGAMTFTSIRDSSAPEQYSWEVQLEEDQELKLLDSQHALVSYEEGHTAFSISAVPARDAIGTSVPTSLSVSGDNIVTLTVQFKAGNGGVPFVYPIIAGAGWQGGFVTYNVEMPPPEPLPGEEEEEVEEEWEELDVAVKEDLPYARVSLSAQGPPVAHAASKGSLFSHRYKFSECRYQPEKLPKVPTPATKRKWLIAIEGNCMQEQDSTDLYAGLSLRGWYWYKPQKEIWTNSQEEDCKKWGPYKPAMVHCEAVPRRDDQHVVLYGNFRFPAGTLANIVPAPQCDTLWAVLTVGAPHKHERESLLNWVDPGDPCDWPQR